MCLGSAGGEEGRAAPHSEGSNVGRVKAIHVLLDADGFQHALLIYVLRQRQLHEDPVYCRVCIVLAHHLGPPHPLCLCLTPTSARLDTLCNKTFVPLFLDLANAQATMHVHSRMHILLLTSSRASREPEQCLASPSLLHLLTPPATSDFGSMCEDPLKAQALVTKSNPNMSQANRQQVHVTVEHKLRERIPGLTRAPASTNPKKQKSKPPFETDDVAEHQREQPMIWVTTAPSAILQDRYCITA